MLNSTIAEGLELVNSTIFVTGNCEPTKYFPPWATISFAETLTIIDPVPGAGLASTVNLTGLPSITVTVLCPVMETTGVVCAEAVGMVPKHINVKTQNPKNEPSVDPN